MKLHLETNYVFNALSRSLFIQHGCRALVGLLLLAGTVSMEAQTVRFRSSPVRVTVPLNSTTATVITNQVYLSDEVVNPVAFDVTGLPAGAGYSLTDSNGVPVTSISASMTNLLLTIHATNIAHGLHHFQLNASGGATNSVPLILQAAHVWSGSLNVSNNWNDASAWGASGIPTTGGDVVFGDQGAQTNISSGIGFTNIGVSANVTVGSVRFSQTGRTNAAAIEEDLRPISHTIHIAPAATLSLTGTNGFSLLRDEVEGSAGGQPFHGFVALSAMNVNMVGGGRLVVSNANANFAMLIPNQDRPVLNISNLNRFDAHLSRFAIADYELYPNYENYNGLNDFQAYPRQFMGTLHLARTNFITALHRDADNYTNQFNRTYGFRFGNSERFGVGSSVASIFEFGLTNRILADGVCFAGANMGGVTVRFNPGITNSAAVFRGTNGGRMSVFTISDGASWTNEAASNVKGTVDFSGGNGLVDILTDRFYIARDRTLIRSNDNPTFEGTMTIGRGVLDANVAVLGFQEHDGKTNWTAMGGQVYRGYCRAELVVTNGGLFRVNDVLTLGYTADTNPEGSAQQYNTRGTITIASNSTVSASSIVCDGGLNFVSFTEPRQNAITISEGGLLIVTNTIGAAPGLPLDNLTMRASTLWLRPVAGKTNVFVKNLSNLGSVPSVVKIVGISGVSVYPTNIPLISYETAVPFLTADMSASGLTGVQGYIINNADNKTIDLFLTTNSPRQLRWTGSANNLWDLSSINWMTTNNTPTAFSLGDIVTFDDSSSVTNISIATVVVPNQSGSAGVTITNATRTYVFDTSGGAIAGTASIVKQGPGGLVFNASESGPLFMLGGTLTGSGVLGNTTIASNVTVNFAGAINGLTSTGMVTVPSAGTISGAVALRGGWLQIESGGVVNASSLVLNDVAVTNKAGGMLGVVGTYEVTTTSVLANFGTINHNSQINAARMNISGLFFGNGSVFDVDGTDIGRDGRVNMLNVPDAIVSPGAAPINSIGNMFMGTRVDLHAGNPNNSAGRLWIEVDFNHPDVNDKLLADRWNNIENVIVMTNINPGAGSFASGQTFQIFQNNNGVNASNFVDTIGIYPLMSPPVPGPGLQWDLSRIRVWGSVGITNSPLIWDGTGGAIWDANAGNTTWKNGKAYSDRQGAIFDDTASGSTDITLNAVVAPAGFGRETNIVEGVSTNFITEGPAFSPGMMFNNASKDYTVSGPGRITGMTSLYKSGSGTLTMLTTNDFIGGVVIDGGTVAITNVNGLGVAANTANLFGHQGAYNQILINGGTLRYFGPTNATLSRFITSERNNATIDVTDYELTVNQNVRGNGSLTKTGAGVLVLTSTGNDFIGANVSQGTLRLTAAAAGRGAVTLNGTTLELTNTGAGMTITNGINIVGAGSTILNFKTNVLGGRWSGNGSVTFSSASSVVFNGSMTGFSGTISFGTSSGSFRLNNTTNNENIGSPLAAFDLGTGSATLSNLHGGGLTYHLGALSGGANTILAGRVTNSNPVATSTYSIGAKGTSTAFDGRIMNGLDTVSVTKVGSGALYLNGNNAYTGSTIVSAGVLGGSGSINGPLTVEAGGTLAPGTSVGTFTVNGAATLQGTVLMELNRNAAPSQNDRLVASSITAGGALIVTNIGPDLVNGTTFQLFSTGAPGFTSVVLPPTDPTGTKNYTWNNNIAASGSITLVSGGTTGVNNNPTNITTSVSGGNITLSWPSSHIGWQLWSNSASLTDTSKWFLITGSDLTNQIESPVDMSKTNVFFRLQLP